jgi:hypothetical protein
MAREVEGDGHVAAARERQCEGLHQLLRAGEAVGDQDDRWWHCGRLRGPERRDRYRAHPLRRDAQSQTSAFEMPDADRDGQQREERHAPRFGNFPCRAHDAAH